MERYEGKGSDYRRHERHGARDRRILLDGGACVLVTGLSNAGLWNRRRKSSEEGALVVSSDARWLTCWTSTLWPLG